jgi:hypothetical protein
VTAAKFSLLRRADTVEIEGAILHIDHGDARQDHLIVGSNPAARSAVTVSRPAFASPADNRASCRRILWLVGCHQTVIRRRPLGCAFVIRRLLLCGHLDSCRLVGISIS